jgi:putative flippase GtrA
MKQRPNTTPVLPSKSFKMDGLKRNIQKYTGSSLYRYILIGGVSYLIEVSILITLYGHFHANKTIATTASFWIGLLLSFLLQKLLAFKDYKREIRAISGQMAWFAGLVIVNYLFTLLVISLLPGEYLIIGRTVALIITTTWNYVIYKKIIFS